MGKASSFTPTIDLLKGAKWRARACSWPAKNAPAQLASVLAKIYPPDDYVGLACTAHLRTAFWALCLYHTLCRYSCFTKLQVKPFESVGDTFPSSNAQRPAVVPCNQELSTMPVQDHETILSPLRAAHGGRPERRIFHQLPASASVGPSLTRPEFRSQPFTGDWWLLRAFCGHPVPQATDKTPKVTGVTAALEAGATLHEVSQADRWHMQDVMLRFKENLLAYKREVVLKVPSLQPP